jgi:predicted O-linked N-acetylglucosamine transferase (SPINDLY family)
MRAGTAADRALFEAPSGQISVAALISITETLKASDFSNRIPEILRSWLKHNEADPLAFAVRYNLAVALGGTEDEVLLREAAGHLQSALAQRPDFAPAAINLGTLLERLNDRLGAVVAWQALAGRLSSVTGDAIRHRCTAINQIGRVLETARIAAPAEAALRASLEIDPGQHLVAQHFISLRQGQCKWPVVPHDGPLPPPDMLANISPLSLAALIDDPLLQLANASAYAARDGQPDGARTVGAWPPPVRRGKRRLRIGYVSSDFREHAVGYLTAELFELHDRGKVESFAYYCGPARDDSHKSRFRLSAEHWRDISPLSDRQAAICIVNDGIDILVDVNGYTKDGRPKLFAYRPAPCIVNWLGFPGTTGSPHHHYILADRFIIPEGDEIFYSEKVLHLPCYQPNDRRRRVAEASQTRAEAGLPDDGFVFIAFNGTQKITPDVFNVWMCILRAAPGSVLWLLCPDEDTFGTLRRLAGEAGVDPARLVRAVGMANSDHLARFGLADLFLDTSPYGAHTTASDALWVGVPVLTRVGNCFAARVCGSLVHAAGLPELVCEDWQSYQNTAIRLAKNPQEAKALSAKLAANRDTCKLFDTPLLVRSLEKLYLQVWNEHIAGRTPFPDTRGLETYRRIGCDLNRPALPSRGELMDWYSTRLRYENAHQPLPADKLLWRTAIGG